MDDKTLTLLDRHSTLILPEQIDHDAYALLLEALLHIGSKSLVLYCRGIGGGSRDALAMVDLMQRHGGVIGMLAGEACSSHGIIWAACAQRFVYPHGRLAVHMVARDGISTRVDAHVLKQMAQDSKETNQLNAIILSNASNCSIDWWNKVIKKAGSAETGNFSAAMLIAMDMARPIAEYVPLEPAPVGERLDAANPHGFNFTGYGIGSNYIDAVSGIPIPK